MFFKIADQVSRFLVGCLFIFSGFIKLVDPIGTKIKMEEYFEVFAEDFGSFFDYFIPFALEIGMLMIVLEIVLGVAVLIYYRMRITTIVLLVLIVFFTFLTGYSHFLDKVTDCGCFGDFIKLTPKQSFIKDLILMVFVLHLFWYRKKYTQQISEKIGHAIIAGVTVICFFLGIHAVRHLPLFDFRAYKIGNNIKNEMQPEEQPIIEYIFEKNGEEVRSQKFLLESDGYTYKDSHVLNEDKITAKITDYAVSDADGNDVTENTFEGAKLIFVMYDVAEASTANIEAIQTLTKELEGQVDMMLITASPAAEVDKFRHEHQLAVPYYFADATVLKTIIRSNPGITLWVDGTVKAKWHHNDAPAPEGVKEKIKG